MNTVDAHRAAPAHGYQLLGAHISKFDGLPTSTLHTFLDPGLYYWYKPCSN